jgi:ubiquinone biosynthesis protein
MKVRKYVPTPLVERYERKPLELIEATEPNWFRLLSSLRDVFTLTFLILAARGSTTGLIERARRVRAFIESRGGIWVKVGQLLSTRRDAFPAEFCDELERLQDRVRGFPVEQARRTIERELDRPIESVFSEFIDQPIAAASVGQVHRARLSHNGVLVAVKVQRPFVEEAFKRDLQLVRFLTGVMNRFDFSGRLRWFEMYDELERMLTEELEFRIEAGSLARMHRTLKEHKTIYSPKPYIRFCTRRVLVMEWIQGVTMSEYLKLALSDPHRVDRWRDENDIDPTKVARNLYLSVQRQFYEDNLFHADLHPGNIMLLRKNRIAMIDFGSVGKLEEKFRLRVLLYNRFLQEGEFGKAMLVLVAMSGPLPPTDVSTLITRLVRNQQRFMLIANSEAFSQKERSDNDATQEQARILGEYNIPINWDFLRITRTMSALQISLLSLDPKCNYFTLQKAYFADSERRRRARRDRGVEAEMRELLANTLTIRKNECDRAIAVDDSLNFLTTKTRGGAAAEEALRLARRLLGASIPITLALFLAQHHPFWIPPPLRGWAESAAGVLPRLGQLVWIGLGTFLMYIHRVVKRL